MTIEFNLPAVAEGIETADVAEISVSVGDNLKPGEVVMEMETEKAVAEIECPYGGRVTQIHVAEGDSIPIGARLLTLEENETSEEPVQKLTPASPPLSSPSETPPSKKTAPQASPPTTTSHRVALDRSTDTKSPPPPAGPSTRRLARELGVNLHNVQGSGPGGRITPDDVQSFVRSILKEGTQSSATEIPRKQSALNEDFSKYGPVERRKLNKLSRTSAEHLHYSWQTIPHVTQHDLADITNLEKERKLFLSQKHYNGPKITMTAIMIKAVVSTLNNFPLFNSSFDSTSNELILKNYFHIGVAVDTEAGLVVPVIRNADKKNIIEIAEELVDVAQRARDRKLKIEDMQGGTFTITNLGGIGGTSFTPIVNHPEIAILGMSRSQKIPQLENGVLTERLMLPLSLSYDHRVINGAEAARFIVQLSAMLANHFQLVISN